MKDGDKMLMELRLQQLKDAVYERDKRFRMLLFKMYMEGK